MTTNAAALTPEHRSWRTKVFVATWVSYVGFYFCRKPFSAAKAAIGHETHWNATTLGNIWAAYLVAYALGQFVAAAMGTRFGPRKNVLAGMAISIVVTLFMARTLSIELMALLVGVNGLAQATGWSGNVGTMGSWFQKHERGRVMGAWANCFTVGALTSGWTMAWVLGRHATGEPAPWRDCFMVGGAVLGVAWLVFWLFQRDNPESAGLTPIEDPQADNQKKADAEPGGNGLGLSRDAWTNLLLVAGFYFFAKFIRYAIWSWAAYFLEKNFGLTGSRANVYATAFDLMGIPGIYLTGWISDRFFGARRGGVATIMMIAMTVLTALMMTLGSTSVTVFAIFLGLVGFTLYGPDAILTSAGAIDISGNRRAATFTTAFISGFGSFGAIVQELVIARSYDSSKGELGPVLAMLFGSAALATVFCVALVLRDRRGNKGI